MTELARQLANGEMDLEGWKWEELETPELRRRLKGLKGVGDYAVANLLMCLGRHELLPRDSWARKLIKAKFFPGKVSVKDRELAAASDRFGKWKFLAYWFYDWKK